MKPATETQLIEPSPERPEMHKSSQYQSPVSRRRLLSGLVALAAAGSLFAAGRQAEATGKKQPLAAAQGRNISGADALSLAQRGAVTIVDVRSPQEWKQTGVPAGARAITIHDPQGLAGFVRAVTRSVNGNLDTPVALICARGNRSTRALDALQAAGFTQVLNIEEGMLGSASGPGWLAQDLPLETCKAC